MPPKSMSALALAGLLAVSIAATVVAQELMVDPAMATMSPEQLVEARQDAMKQNGAILRNAGSLSGADAVAAADTTIQNFINLPAMFAEGSIVGNSKALPVIWEEKEAFDAIFGQAAAIAVQMKTAAEAGDTAAFGEAARGLGPLCGQCHNKYRS